MAKTRNDCCVIPDVIGNPYGIYEDWISISTRMINELMYPKLFVARFTFEKIFLRFSWCPSCLGGQQILTFLLHRKNAGMVAGVIGSVRAIEGETEEKTIVGRHQDTRDSRTGKTEKLIAQKFDGAKQD